MKKKIVKNRYVLKSKNKSKLIKKNSNKKQVKKKKLLKVKNIPVIIPEVIPIVKTRRSRKAKTPSDKMYFTQSTEDYIIKYNAETDVEKRNEIYNNYIKYPFEKLVENIFNTFKFSYFETGPLDVQKETVSHLVANIFKFQSEKGKAFAYFSIIAKHYLIALNNSTWKRRNQHIEIGEEHGEHTVQLQSEDKHHKQSEMREFINLMIEFWENNVGKLFNKQRDLDIANAVIELFRHTENISMFNKKALYLYIREISNCKTQQITKVINKMKSYQTNISRSYVNDGVINTAGYMKS